MKAKKISLTNREQIILQTMVRMNIMENKEAERMGIEPAKTTEELKALYKKIAGFEYKDLD